MKKISAEIVADSINPQGNRITTMLVTFPRFILAELNTHRMFSKNSASSRAIPFKKMVEMVENDPFIPIAWQKDHKGMQGSEYITDEEAVRNLRNQWIEGSLSAIKTATGLHKGAYTLEIAKDEEGHNMRGFNLVEIPETSVTKQLCNRLLEPFMWHTVLITATEWQNFFKLRCPQYEVSWYPSNRPEATEPTTCTFYSKKDAIAQTENACYNWIEEDWREVNTSQAEIHIQALAETMWDTMNESTPKKLEAGEWHIPFGDKIDINPYSKIVAEVHHKILEKYDNFLNSTIPTIDLRDIVANLKLKIATARAARLSYMTFDNKIDYEKDIKLHDDLLESEHMSPFEHCARAMSEGEYYSFVKGQGEQSEMDDALYFSHNQSSWCNNFKGWIQYRYLIENEKL